MSDDTDSVAVHISIGGVERCEGCGSLAAQAIVRLSIHDVDVTLQGVQLRRMHDGRLCVQAPRFRHWRTGQWLPAVVMDPTITDAIATELLEAMAA